jgi:hypothetical protein
MPPIRPKDELPDQGSLVAAFKRRTSRPPPPAPEAVRSFELMLEDFVKKVAEKDARTESDA